MNSKFVRNISEAIGFFRKYMSLSNQEIEVWESDDPHTLCDKYQMLNRDVSHTLYLGRELMRARQCLIDGTE